MALLHRPRAEDESESESEGESESELEGALLAVEHVNRLAWRYFVQNVPYQGESVMQEVCMICWSSINSI